MTEVQMLVPVDDVIERVTERTVLDALHVRYSQVSQGNTIRYAVAEHVRNGAGFSATNTADFIAMDLWPSFGKGLHLHGHEVKVSRSDWLRELKQPWKAEAFTPYMNLWWIVVSDSAIVKRDELPEGWGLLALTKRGLRCEKAATVKEAEPLTKSMIAALLRAVQVTATRRFSSPPEERVQGLGTEK